MTTSRHGHRPGLSLGILPQVRVQRIEDVPQAPFPMAFTRSAMAALLATVGLRPPESGAMGFSRCERIGFGVVEFDRQGSAGASSAVYRPDREWGDVRQRHHLDLEGRGMRLWSGSIHSHPGGMGHPSRKSGRGLGDLGYVEEVFAHNETMQFFLLPILTGCGPGAMSVALHPWIVERGKDAPRLLAAPDVVVVDEEEFPQRSFNPEWLRRQEGGADPDPSPAVPPFPAKVGVPPPLA